MNIKNNKIGNTALTLPIVTTISIILIVFVGIYVVNTILPFIWYEKLNSLSQKYMFVIEKYGYLTSNEKQNLMNELKNQGFDIENIKLKAPSEIKDYGELIEFEIKYNFNQNNPIIKNKNIGKENKNIELVIYKNSYSKR